MWFCYFKKRVLNLQALTPTIRRHGCQPSAPVDPRVRNPHRTISSRNIQVPPQQAVVAITIIINANVVQPLSACARQPHPVRGSAVRITPSQLTLKSWGKFIQYPTAATIIIKRRHQETLFTHILTCLTLA